MIRSSYSIEIPPPPPLLRLLAQTRRTFSSFYTRETRFIPRRVDVLRARLYTRGNRAEKTETIVASPAGYDARTWARRPIIRNRASEISDGFATLSRAMADLTVGRSAKLA